MIKEISIENYSLQEDILLFASWKLYQSKQFPNHARLIDIMMKKEINGELTIKLQCQFNEEDESQKFSKSISQDNKILPEEVAFQLGEGKYKIPINDKEIELEYIYSSEIYVVSHDLCPFKKLILRGEEETLCHFISQMDEYTKKTDDKHFKILNPNPKGYWEVLFKNSKRDIQTVFINKKQEIIDDIDEFINSETDYKIFGHPYKRNYLFYGPPGNGKTSFINAIASKYNLNVYLVSFSAILTDELFKRLISIIPRNALLVMEDIDVLFDEKEKKNLSLSTVLNIMDGLARKNRIISIMTTNNYDRLTDIFKRPGRIDMTIEFTKADEECFEQMAEFMCKYHKNEEEVEVKQNALNFYNMVAHMEPSRALVQKYLFENRKRSSSEIFSRKMINKFKEMHNEYYNQNSENSNKKPSLYA